MKTLFLMLFFGAATLANAQTDRDNMSLKETKQTRTMGSEQSQKFQNAEEVAKGLNITAGEAEKVWSIYTEYRSAGKKLMEKNRESMKRSKAGGEKMTNQEYEKTHRAGFETRRERINLDETYYNRLLEVLPASKVHLLLKQDRKRKPVRTLDQKPEQTRTRMQQTE